MSNINKWAYDVKKNRKEYAGLRTVKDLLKKAHERGYDVSEKEILNFNLGNISGGAWLDLGLGFKFDNSKHNTNITTEEKHNTTTINQDAYVQGNDNNISYSNDIHSNQ